MKIIFEDSDIVVCIKPYGVISQNNDNGNDMVKMLSEKLNSSIFPVHRLDRETGGIMVYAKNSISAAKLSRDVMDKKVKKEYLALIHNVITSDTAELCDLLFRDKQKNKSYVVKRERKGVKQAILTYNKINSFESEYGTVSLVRVSLKTGRTHQIRVQFASRGYSLVGDKRYGAKDNAEYLGLWSCYLEFNHPTKNETLKFEVLPENEGIFNFKI